MQALDMVFGFLDVEFLSPCFLDAQVGRPEAKLIKLGKADAVIAGAAIFCSEY